MNRCWAWKTMVDSIEYARSLGMEVLVGFEDATRCDLKFRYNGEKYGHFTY